MTGTILFLDVGNPDFLPLVRAVAGQGFLPVLNTSCLTSRLPSAGVPFRPLEAFVPPQAQAHVSQEVARVSAGLAEALRNRDAVRQVFASPSGDLLSHLGSAFFRKLTELLSNEIVVVDTFEALARETDLRLIVLGCDNSHTQRAAIGSAARQGVPTLQLAHGLAVRPMVRVAGQAVYADYVAAFGPRARDNLVAIGTAPGRILVTGAPLWDPYYRPAARVALADAKLRLGLDPEQPVVLFCSSYADASSAFFAAVSRRLLSLNGAVIDAVSRLGPNVQLVVRPHPHELTQVGLPAEEQAELIQAFRTWAAAGGTRNVRVSVGEQTDPVRALRQKVETIRAADVVVVVGSSSVVPEAMILQRPVVIVPLGMGELSNYTERDGLSIVDDGSQLGDLLAGLLSDPARRAAMVERQNAILPELNYGNDGRATERVAALIGQLASRPGRRTARWTASGT